MYHLWEPLTEVAVTVAVVTTINQENKIGLALDQVVTVSTRICRRVNATVPITSLR